MIRRLILVVALALVVGGSSGCLRHVYGDSLGAQVVASGLTDGDQFEWHVESGASLERWADDVTAAAATTPRTIVLALGSNDAATWKPDYGWTAHDEAVWSWVVASVRPDTCLVVVLPAFTAAAEAAYPGVLAEVEQARQWLRTLPASRVDRVVDWRTFVDAHPDDFPDGIHVGTARAVEARYDLSTVECT